MITFHRLLFIGVLAVAFFEGALNEGRKDLLDQFMTAKLLRLSLSELSVLQIERDI